MTGKKTENRCRKREKKKAWKKRKQKLSKKRTPTEKGAKPSVLIRWLRAKEKLSKAREGVEIVQPQDVDRTTNNANFLQKGLAFYEGSRRICRH